MVGTTNSVLSVRTFGATGGEALTRRKIKAIARVRIRIRVRVRVRGTRQNDTNRPMKTLLTEQGKKGKPLKGTDQ